MKTDFDFTKSGSFEIDGDGDLTIKDSKGNWIYYKEFDGGFESWCEYDEQNLKSHYINCTGYELWYNAKGDKHYHSDSYEQWYDESGDYITKEQFDNGNCSASVQL